MNIQTFWGNVDIKTDEECWPWKGTLSKGGYGYKSTAHRLAYKFTKGHIPKGLLIMHSCNNPACCNPKHLSPGTYQENNKYTHTCGRNSPVKTSLTMRKKLRGTGLQFDKRSNFYSVMFKVLGKPLYIGVYKDPVLAKVIAKAAMDEAEKLLITTQFITYEQVKEHFHA